MTGAGARGSATDREGSLRPPTPPRPHEEPLGRPQVSDSRSPLHSSG